MPREGALLIVVSGSGTREIRSRRFVAPALFCAGPAVQIPESLVGTGLEKRRRTQLDTLEKEK